MWSSDGWDVRTRLGVLIPHGDVGPESELQAMAPDGVGIHSARVPFGGMAAGGAMDPTIPLAPVQAFVEPPAIDEATALLAAAPINAIGIGFTSSSYVGGPDGERKVVDRLAERAGMPVVAPCAAAVAGFGALGIDRSPDSVHWASIASRCSTHRGSMPNWTATARSTSGPRAWRSSYTPPANYRATSAASTRRNSSPGSSGTLPQTQMRSSSEATASAQSASSPPWKRICGFRW